MHDKSIWHKDLVAEHSEEIFYYCRDNSKCSGTESCLLALEGECQSVNCVMCGSGTHCDDKEIDPPPPSGFGVFKAMVVGDSISHGMAGDFTWRWRIFSWRKL